MSITTLRDVQAEIDQKPPEAPQDNKRSGNHKLRLKNRKPLPGQPKVGIRHSFAKRIAIVEDIQAGLSWGLVRQKYGVGTDTIANLLKDPQLHDTTNPHIVKIRRNNLANIFETIADYALSHVSEEKLSKMNAYQLVVIAAMSVDKTRLLQNLPTMNISVQGIVGDISKELMELKKKRLSLDLASTSTHIRDAKFTGEVSADKLLADSSANYQVSTENALHNIDQDALAVEVVDNQEISSK